MQYGKAELWHSIKREKRTSKDKLGIGDSNNGK